MHKYFCWNDGRHNIEIRNNACGELLNLIEISNKSKAKGKLFPVTVPGTNVKLLFQVVNSNLVLKNVAHKINYS